VDDWLDGRLRADQEDDELVLDATWRTGASARGARRIIALLGRGHLPPERFACLTYSNWAAGLEVATLAQLLEELARRTRLRPTALTMLGQRLHRRAEDWQPLAPLAARLVSDPNLVLKDRSAAWTDVASFLMRTHTREVVRGIMAAHARDEEASLFFSLAANTLQECAAHDPPGVWAELAPYLEDEKKVGQFVIGFPQGIVDSLPHQRLLEWAGASPDRRASALARLAAPNFTCDDSLASKLADRYGERETVGAALFAQLTSGGTWGPLSDRWAELAAQMERVSRTTRLPGLRRWARQAAERLRKMETHDREHEAERELLLTLQ
jgi:hypothetical protein